MGEAVECRGCGVVNPIAGLCEMCADQVKPTRTRVHVGYRVVRMRDGVRQYLSSELCGGSWVLRAPEPWENGAYAKRAAERNGGRVVKVFLSYSDETRNGMGR